MSMGEVLLLIQTIVVSLALLIVGWQIYKLRVATQTASCQDIVGKFFRIVENPDFQKLFSFGSDWEQIPEEERKKTVLCSMVFAFLEQLYVEASAGQLTQRLSGPWVEFVTSWVNQEKMKQYWRSSTMICPKRGFDAGFQKFVDETYET